MSGAVTSEAIDADPHPHADALTSSKTTDDLVGAPPRVRPSHSRRAPPSPRLTATAAVVAATVRKTRSVRSPSGRTFKKSNSTGSLFLTSTLNMPDTSELVKCMARMALRMMEESAAHPAPPKYPVKVYAVFDDPEHQPGQPFPATEQLARFIKSIVDAGDIAPQSCVLFIIVLDRLRSRMAFKPQNWKRIVLSSLILGCKVWEDEAVWNSDFQALFPRIDNKTLAALEKQLLLLLSYHVTMSSSEYADTFFKMKELSPSAFSVEEPLTEAEIKQLEERSSAFEAAVRNARRPTKSVDIMSNGRVRREKKSRIRTKKR